MNRTHARTGAVLAGALLGSVLGLSGCDDGRPAAEPPAPAAPSTPNPTLAPTPSMAPDGGVPSVGELSSTGQGLEIRYLDENGNPQVLAPKDFPRR